jgi:hypothetical protein
MKLRVGELTISVTADRGCRDCFERFSRAWACAVQRGPDGPVAAHVSARLVDDEGSIEVLCDGVPLDTHFDPNEGHWALERALYEAISRHQRSGTEMLHGGCVIKGDRGFLFLGPSGAGKSSLSLAALRAGYQYLSDDVLLTDGRSVVGVPRAIQFDGPDQEGGLPEWLLGSDVDQNIYPSFAPGDQNARPLVIPELDKLAGSVRAEHLRVVLLERGIKEEIQVMSPVETLSQLVDAAYRPLRGANLGALASRGGAVLRWTDPERGLASLEAFWS